MFESMQAFVGSALLFAFMIFVVFLMAAAAVALIMLATWTSPLEARWWLGEKLLRRKIKRAKKRVRESESCGCTAWRQEAEAKLEDAQGKLREFLDNVKADREARRRRWKDEDQVGDRRNLRVQGARLLWAVDGLGYSLNDAMAKLSDEELWEVHRLAMVLAGVTKNERMHRLGVRPGHTENCNVEGHAVGMQHCRHEEIEIR